VIDRAVDPQTGSIRIRLVFPNPKNELKVGMSCVVRVHNLDTSPQMVIPGKAVIEQMGEYFVYVAKDTVMASKATGAKSEKEPDEKGSRLRAIQRKVKVGQTIGGNIVVLSGINDGDQVVVAGIQSIHDGSPVELAEKSKVKSQK
jgi:membrane fusion protein (multidrug efflux system)